MKPVSHGADGSVGSSSMENVLMAGWHGCLLKSVSGVVRTGMPLPPLPKYGNLADHGLLNSRAHWMG